ncbi:hypothetical protein T4D_13229 [Trichinella pseudospiralis]|uniref:Uncharacterized protein n=1 Tax=Trichinella pseudospiralis TaxID=6337 RepID=A0A0V1FPP5_TRIPS|nr:hypothetical protein T4D_13229 [Trichinella pseudospiralis]
MVTNKHNFCFFFILHHNAVQQVGSPCGFIVQWHRLMRLNICKQHGCRLRFVILAELLLCLCKQKYASSFAIFVPSPLLPASSTSQFIKRTSFYYQKIFDAN